MLTYNSLFLSISGFTAYLSAGTGGKTEEKNVARSKGLLPNIADRAELIAIPETTFQQTKQHLAVI